jgi:hypothetical protein
MLLDDVMNNSAWAYKYFLLVKKGELTVEVIKKETEEVFDKYLPRNWQNESAWSYIRGFLANSDEEEA